MSDFTIEGKTIGFLGCGKISSALCRGFATHPCTRPAKILVSRRSEAKSERLREDFPSLVEVLESNAEIVERAEVVFLGLLPAVAAEELPRLCFREDQLVISMMAAVSYARTLQLLRRDEESDTCTSDNNVVRTVPLPSSARRTGPILLFPANTRAEAVLRLVGTPVVCQDEQEMKPMISVTGHISSFYELMRTTEKFIVDNGVEERAARDFVTSFYSSLASGAEQSHESLAELRDEAATPGGLNEQSINFLTASPHFDLQTKSLGSILDRLNGKQA